MASASLAHLTHLLGVRSGRAARSRMQQILKAKLHVEETGIIQRMAQGPALNYVENMTDFTVEIERSP